MYTKYVRNIFVPYRKHKIVRNEFLNVQSTTNNAVIPFYKLTGKFKLEHSRYTR
jgi:hypothetical protein